MNRFNLEVAGVYGRFYIHHTGGHEPYLLSTGHLLMWPEVLNKYPESINRDKALYFFTKEKAELCLDNYLKGTKMENLKERLVQCRKDKGVIEQQEKELVQQIEDSKEPEYKHGDVFRNSLSDVVNKLRILVQLKDTWFLFDSTGCSIKTGTYDKCVNYIYNRSGKLGGDDYEYVGNLFNIVKGN